jgi:hypothetical protein
MSWLLWFPLFFQFCFPKQNQPMFNRALGLFGQTNSVLFVLAFSALVTLGIPPTSLLSTDHLLDHILSSGLALILASCSCKAEMLPSLGPLHY